MKKIARVLALVAVIVLMFSSVAFALNIESTYPEEGKKNVSLENMGITVFTDGTFTLDKQGESSDSYCQIYGPEGEKVPTKVFFSETDPSMLLVLAYKDADGKMYMAESDSDYKLVLSSGLTDDKGSTLSSDYTVTFHTLNQKRANTVNMVMMFVLFGGIMVVTTFSQRKTKEKEEPATKKDTTVNPYKEAKRTGKSVSEIVEKDKANKKKEAEKAEKQAERRAKRAEKEDEYLEEGHYRVKGRRPAVNSVYVDKKKAEAEARRQAEAERKAQEEKWKAQAKKKSKKKK